MAHLHQDIATLLKDGLRGARYLVRKTTRAGDDADPLRRGVHHLTSLADAVLSTTEETVSSLLRGAPGDEARSDAALMRACRRLSGLADADAFETLFTRTVYRLAETLLTRRGIDNLFIAEHDIAAAARDLVPPAARDGTDPARFWAEAAVALVARRPIRDIEAAESASADGTGFATEPNAAVFLTIALAGAVAATKDLDAAGLGAVPDSAAAVMDVRFRRFADCLDRRDPARALAAEIASVLPFLP